MTLESVGKVLATVLPTIKTKLQLTGVALVIAAWVIVEFAQPGNTQAMLTSGAIGISTIIFAQLFHFLTDFPARSRARVFLGAFAMFCVLVVVLLITTVMLLSQPTMDVTLEEDAALGVGVRPSVPSVSAGGASLLWGTAWASQRRPQMFAPTTDDSQLRREAEEFGTGVRYSIVEKAGVIEVNALMPYLRKMRGEGFIVPLTVDRFRWVPPVLSFKINNPRFATLFVTQARIEAASVTNEDEPLLIVHDAKPWRKPGAKGDERYYPLSFYNVSKGVVRSPVIRFSIVRNEQVENASRVPFKHVVPMRAFDGDLDLDLKNYIDKKLQRHKIDPDIVLSEVASRAMAVNYGGGSILEYLNVIGQIQFNTERGEKRLANFRAKIYFTTFGPGRINPSYRYNVFLPEDVRDFPISVPLSQCIARRSADNFLMAFNSPRSARYDLTVNVKSTDGVVLTKRIVLHTMVSRNYGLAQPEKINAFFSIGREGCT